MLEGCRCLLFGERVRVEVGHAGDCVGHTGLRERWVGGLRFYGPHWRRYSVVRVGATTAVEEVDIMACVRNSGVSGKVVGLGFTTAVEGFDVGACMWLSGLDGCWFGVSCCRRRGCREIVWGVLVLNCSVRGPSWMLRAATSGYLSRTGVR